MIRITETLGKILYFGHTLRSLHHSHVGDLIKEIFFHRSSVHERSMLRGKSFLPSFIRILKRNSFSTTLVKILQVQTGPQLPRLTNRVSHYCHVIVQPRKPCSLSRGQILSSPAPKNSTEFVASLSTCRAPLRYRLQPLSLSRASLYFLAASIPVESRLPLILRISFS